MSMLANTDNTRTSRHFKTIQRETGKRIETHQLVRRNNARAQCYRRNTTSGSSFQKGDPDAIEAFKHPYRR